MKRIIGYMFCILTILSGCDNDYNEHGVDIPSCQLYINVVNANGTNVLDSLKVSPDDSPWILESDVAIRCVRNRDGQELETFDIGWLNSNWGGKSGIGRVLYFTWVDNVFYSGKNRPAKRYDDCYSLFLKDKRIFGTDKPQEIKCYVHIKNNLCDGYRYEVNGKKVEVPVSCVFYDDSKIPDHRVKALIRIEI